jgi:hypothetical protein
VLDPAHLSGPQAGVGGQDEGIVANPKGGTGCSEPTERRQEGDGPEEMTSGSCGTRQTHSLCTGDASGLVDRRLSPGPLWESCAEDSRVTG